MDTGLTADDLKDFTGRMDPYGSYVTEAISQAEDLFALATALTSLPTDEFHLRVASRGILEMAEYIYEGQQYRALRFSPFRSQNIGSYSYMLAERAVLDGIPTGVAWFDIAVNTLALEPRFSAQSVHVFDRPGDIVDENGVLYLPGPADYHREVRVYGADPADESDWPGFRP